MRCAKCGHLWHQLPSDKPAESAAPTDKFQRIRPSDTPAGLPSTGLRLLPTVMIFAAGILFGLTFSLNRIPFIPYVF